jgi:hypothetical protein
MKLKRIILSLLIATFIGTCNVQNIYAEDSSGTVGGNSSLGGNKAMGGEFVGKGGTPTSGGSTPTGGSPNSGGTTASGGFTHVAGWPSSGGIAGMGASAGIPEQVMRRRYVGEPVRGFDYLFFTILAGILGIITIIYQQQEKTYKPCLC